MSKNQPDAFPVQYTQLSLGQATKLQTTAVEPEKLYSYSGTAKVLTQQFHHAPPVSSYTPRNQDLHGYTAKTVV